MPIYEYECRECGHVFDALQKMSDPVLTDCPACTKPELRKLLSAPNFRLKGGGWYETDFKAANRRNLADGTDAKSGKPESASGKPESESGKSSSESGKPQSDQSKSPASAAKATKAGGSGATTGKAD